MEKIEMLKRKRARRKTDPLLLLALFAGLAVFMTTVTAVENSFVSHPDINDQVNGSVMLAPVGRNGASVRVSYIKTDEETPAALTPDWFSSAIRLSVVMPW